MKRLLLIFCLILILFKIFPVDYTWTGLGDSINWGDEANWDDGNGYQIGDGYPDDIGDTATIGVGFNVTLNINNLTISDLTLDGSLSCGSNNFTVSNIFGNGTFDSGSGIISINSNLNISNFIGNSATINITGNVNTTNFTGSSATISVGGSFNFTTFTHNNGTIIMNLGTTPVNLSSASYYNLTINKTNSTNIVLSSGLITILNEININSGIFNINGNNLDVDGSILIGVNGELRCTSNEQINVAKNWDNSGVFTQGSSTVIFDTISSSNILGSTTFNNFTCNTAGKIINFKAGTTQTIVGNFTITGTSGNLIKLQSTNSGTQWFIQDNGTETVSYVKVSDSNASNSITASTSMNQGNNTNWNFPTSTLTWTGTTNTNWNIETNWDLGYVPNDTDNVIIADVANDPLLTSSVTINNLTININGILDTDGFNLTVTGIFSNNGRLRTEGTETLTLTMDTDSGDVEYNGGAGGNISFLVYYNLIINGTGTWVVGADLKINGNLTISSGTLDATGRQILINGNWTNSVGTTGFIETNSNVVFGGTTNVNVSSETWNNIEIDKTAATVTSTGIWNVSGNIILTNGTFAPGNFTHNVSGDWSETNITFIPLSGTINFNGTSNIIQKVGNNFYNLTVSGSVTLLSSLTMTRSLVVNNGATLTLNNFNLTKTGGGAGTISGTVSSNNGNFSYGNNITINATGQININGSGTLTISGTTTNRGIINGGTGLITFTGAYTSNNNGTLNIGSVTTGSNAIIFNNNATFNNTSTFNGSLLTDPIIIVRRNLTFATTITYNQNNDTVSFTSGNASNVNSGGKTFQNIVVNKNTIGVNVTLLANLTQQAGAILTLTQGTLNLNGFTFNLGSDFTQSAGILTIGTGTFNGGIVYNITQSSGTINQSSGTLNCNNFTKNGGTYTISGNGTININNDFSMSAGTINITATPNFNITNNFSITGGSFTANSSILNVSNDFTLSGVYTYNANTSTINVNGNISISGNTFNCGTSTFVMQGVNNKSLVSNQNIYNLTINSTAIKSLGSNITEIAGGLLKILNGTLDLNGFTFNLGSDFTQSAGILTIGAGTFNGASSYSMTFDTGSSVSQSTGIVNCNNFSVNGVAIYNITDLCSINLNGNLTVLSPNWNAGSSTINMSGTNKTINSNQPLNNLNITGSATVNTNDLNIDGNLTINNGILNTGTQDIYVAKNLSITGTGSFIANTKKVIFDGNVDQIFSPSTSTFYDIEVNKTLGMVILNGADLTVNRDFTIQNGNFDTDTRNITVTRDFLINGGSFIPNNKTVTFTGAIDSNFKPNNLNFWNIIINKNASNLRVTQQDNLNNSNNFTIVQGIYDINGNNFSVSNTFSNDGTLELNGNEGVISLTNDTDSGLVRYKGTGAGTLKVGYTYYNLEFNNVTGTWTLSNELTVNNNITITAGTLDAGANQINIGGTWTDTATFLSNVNQITKIFSYGSSSPQLNSETNFKRLIIEASGKTVLISGNITCNYFVLYKGTVTFSNTYTLNVNGDFVALGNNGYINDTLSLDGWDGPFRILDPGTPYSGAINFANTGSNITISNDFYVNGCSLLASSNWNLNIPNNDNDLRKARAYGNINVQRSQASFWVAATDGPINGGGNTNWDFGRPNISLTETRSDNVIFLQFDDLIENTNAEFNNAITNGWIRYNNDTDTFSGAYTDEACTIPLNNVDFNSCYLKISDSINRTWNTGATGSSAGVGTDRSGNIRTIIPNITIKSNYILRDKAKNRIASLPFTYNGTIDRCRPVLISSNIDTETSLPNTFNILRLTFSEPMMAPSITTIYQNSDNTINISAGGSGGGLTIAGNFIGFGIASISGTIITHSSNMNTVKAVDGNKREFIIRLGGNVANGGCIYSNSPPILQQIDGNFQPEVNLRDTNNNLIDTSVVTPITVINNWELTPPLFTSIETNERSGKINGFIDNLKIDFDRSVQVYDNESNFGNSTITWGAITYTVDSVDHSQNSILTDFNLNLIENITNIYGDTNSVPNVNYKNNSNFKFIANSGRVEMQDNFNLIAVDNCNPVITKVSFGIDDPSLFFKSAPYYNTITGAIEDPGSPPYNFNMHSATGGTTLPPTQKTYHNYIMFKFSEPILNLNGVITDSSSDGYSFNLSQKSNASFGDFITSNGTVTVVGFGSFQGDIEVESGSNFILFDDSQTVFIHVAGFYDIGTSKFVGHITNSGLITVPNSNGTHYFTSVNEANITDSQGLSLIKRDTGLPNNDKILIDYEKDWDIIQPVFRYIPPTTLYKGDPVSNEIPPTTLANGAATGIPLLNRVEFVMSKAIRDLDNSTDMSGAFSFTFVRGSVTKPAINLRYSTIVNKLGDVINSYIGTLLIDGDINDQGFSITFDEETGMTDDTRIKWTYSHVGGKIITDLRGLRLQPVSVERYTLENKAPYIKETRSVVGSNKMYVEFNESVYHNPMGDLQIGDFTYTNVFSTGITITNIMPIDNRRYILTLSERLYQNHISQDLIRANAGLIQDSLNNVISSNIDNTVSYIGINFFENVVMEDYIHKGEGWVITKFDGTQKITNQNIKVIAKIDVNKFKGLTPILYYDVIDGDNSKFWYPSRNKEARIVLGISKGNNIWEFNIPSNDQELTVGRELSFVFKIGNLYCYRAPLSVNDPKFSPYDAETYRIKIVELKEQNNKVSIYNNVINPNNNEETKLIYFLEKAGPVSIVVYDLSGNVVKVLVQKTETSGKHIISWNGLNENGKIVTRGVYFIRVRAPGIFNQIRKVLIVK